MQCSAAMWLPLGDDCGSARSPLSSVIAILKMPFFSAASPFVMVVTTFAAVPFTSLTFFSSRVGGARRKLNMKNIEIKSKSSSNYGKQMWKEILTWGVVHTGSPDKQYRLTSIRIRCYSQVCHCFLSYEIQRERETAIRIH